MLVVVAAMAATTGCGSEASSSEKVTDEAAKAGKRAASVAVADELVGTWVTRLRRASTSYLDAGTYTLKVRKDGSVDVYYPRADVNEDCLAQQFCATHMIKASDGTLTILDTDDCHTPAAYSYTVTATKLRTKSASPESCHGDRPRLYDGSVFRRRS